MDVESKRALLAAISEHSYVATAEAIGASATKIGTTIPVNKERRIWRIVASSANDAEQFLGVYNGDTADPDENLLAKYIVGDIAAGGSGLDIGGDPLAPILTAPAPTVADSRDHIDVAHETTTINVTISYYDEPW